VVLSSTPPLAENAVVPERVPDVMAFPETFPGVEITASLESEIAALLEISSLRRLKLLISLLPIEDKVARRPRPWPEMAVKCPESLLVAIPAMLEIFALRILFALISALPTCAIVARGPRPFPTIALKGPDNLLVAISALLAIWAFETRDSVARPPRPWLTMEKMGPDILLVAIAALLEISALLRLKSSISLPVSEWRAAREPKP